MDRPFTSYDKWVTSILSGSLFLCLSSPIFDVLLNLEGTTLLLVKAMIFTIIIRVLLSFKRYQNREETEETRNIVAVINGLMFIVLSPLDNANIVSLLLSFVVYTLTIRLLIN